MHCRLSFLILGYLTFLAACAGPAPTATVSSFKVARAVTASAVVPSSTPAASPSPTLTLTPTPTLIPSATIPSMLGNTVADRQLIGILERCWQVDDPRKLDSSEPSDRAGFDCARAPLLEMTRTSPDYAPSHRLLAWGYYYRDGYSAGAVNEYRTAAALYRKAGDRESESDVRMRLGMILVGPSRAQGCNEFELALSLSPGSQQVDDYLNAYSCGKTIAAAPLGSTPAGSVTPGTTTPTSTGEMLTPPPTYKPARGKILFKSDRAPEGYYMMDADGGNVVPSTAAAYNAASQFEAFSPDRSQVAIVRQEGGSSQFGPNNEIAVADGAGQNPRFIPNPANDYDPAWSPSPILDGLNWLAFVSNRIDPAYPQVQGEELWVMHIDGSGAARLTCHGPSYSKHPSWSADSRQIVFFSNYPGTGNNQIYVLDVTASLAAGGPCQGGAAPANISKNAYNDTEPVWVK